VAPDSDFPLHNLPWGVFSVPEGEEAERRRIGVAIGESVVDVSLLAARGLLSGLGRPGGGPGSSGSSGSGGSGSSQDAFSSCFVGQRDLNALLALGPQAWHETREALRSLLRSSEGALRDNESLRKEAIFDLKEIKSHLPVRVGDFTDFYASKEHATNCGSLFRDPKNALQPNWTSLPVGYHGKEGNRKREKWFLDLFEVEKKTLTFSP